MDLINARNVQNGLGPFSYKWTHGFGDFPTITVVNQEYICLQLSDHTNACTNDASFSFHENPVEMDAGLLMPSQMLKTIYMIL